MKLLQLSVALVLMYSQTAFTRCHKRMANSNAVIAALQNLLGPKNCEKTLPITRMASQWPQMYDEVAPITSYRTMPREISVPNMRLIESKCPCQMGGTYPIRTEFNLDNVLGLPMAPNMPAYTVPMAQMPVYSQPTPEIITVPVPYPIPTTVQNKPACGCPCSAPAPMVSPFLPSASPVSAWAPPTSSMLPPVIPSQARSHFLRKIPIPPPTL